MENQQMAMPAEMAPAGPNPEEMAIYEQMRQEISPQEFSNEMLAGASQIDPQAVAEFTEELRSLDVSPEELDALNDLVDEILANPEQYEQIRQKYLAQGLPDDILPEQFDPNFFAAMNMAVDQMIAAPTGVQAFAQGGIAELKPIAKAIASYGRNGDTMLAHITPAEARMLRRRGGSGTINPSTGLPEFFLKKVFKSIGKAVKKFASSTVGRLVTTVALGFFLGPAAASLVGATSVAGVAAVSGFVGSAGSTLLAGGNLKDALKAGAVGGLTAGAGAGLMGGANAFAANSASTAGLTPGQAFSGQVDKFTNVFSPGAAAPTPGLDAAGQAPVPEAGGDIASKKVTVDLAGNRVSPMDPINGAPAPYSDLKMTGTPVKPFPEFFGDQATAQADPLGNFIQQNDALRTAANTPAALPGASAAYDPATATRAVDYGYKPGGAGNVPAYKPGGPTIGESFSKMGEGLGMGDKPASFKTFTEGATDLFSPGPTKAQLDIKVQEIMGANPSISAKDALTLAKEMAPGALRTYAPAAVAGIGAMSAFGGFDSKPVQGGEITNSLMKPVTQRIREDGTQRQMYMQNLPGVVYDEYGAPVFGQGSRLPTYDVPDYNLGGFGGSGGQGIMNLPSVYIPPPGTIGSRRVEQPYNNAGMYSNLMPRGYDGGGEVAAEPEKTTTIAEPPKKTAEELAAEARAAMEATRARQRAGQALAAQKRAERMAAGSGQMYGNINAGLSALAPENFPGAPVQLDAAREAAMRDAFSQAKAVSDIDYAKVMQQQGYRPEEVAALSGRSFGDINRRYNTALRQDAYAPMLQGQQTAMAEQARIAQPPVGAGSTEPLRSAAETARANQFNAEMEAGIARLNATKGQTSGTAGGMYSNITNPQPGYTGPNLYAQTLAMGMPSRDAMLPAYQYTPLAEGATRKPTIATPTASSTGDMARKQAQYQALLGQGATDAQIRYAGETMFGPQTNADMAVLQGGSKRFMNMGGIAGLAKGGYPRRNGQISGPGTEKSDSIPAMLSDGEFVMTAKAVRGAGKGSRRAGAKQMYKLMHQLEKNAERG